MAHAKGMHGTCEGHTWHMRQEQWMAMGVMRRKDGRKQGSMAMAMGTLAGRQAGREGRERERELGRKTGRGEGTEAAMAMA